MTEMHSNLIKHPSIRKILEHYRVIWSLNHLSGLGNWDLETYMPEEGSEARGEALSKIASLSQKLFLEKEFVELIKESSKLNDLNDYEKAIIRMLLRDLEFYEKLPSAFIEDFVKTTSEATTVWRKAKNSSNFSLFEPYLKKIVELCKKKAEYLGYKESPYDALLDRYEEGLTTKEVEKYFASIKTILVELTNRIKKSESYRGSHSLEEEKYDIETMHKFNQKLLKFIHGELTHLRIDVSSHPFSTSLGKGDARITTRYKGKDFAGTYGSTMHEYGHSLYEIQSHNDLHYTPIAGGSSLIVHESQSRFWENFIGRSEEFLKLIYGDLVEAQPSFKKYDLSEIYKYLNLVKPSLIRTEADEITYHLHILIRFEIEKDLIEGKIDVKDLPKIWNEKYKSYLGVDVPSDREGVLQDIHWSGGSIGYFPTYSLGTALSAMWKHHLEKEIGDIPQLLKSMDGINKIKDWLKKNIHEYGSTYTFRELVLKSCGEEFNPKYLLEYLEDKYGKMWNL
ncbi:MAG: carboxypeptidase M32 [Nanoarchaeota archaeon]|nr:carboxypeptidase M32 [Nanoarchaeota archaeon]